MSIVKYHESEIMSEYWTCMVEEWFALTTLDLNYPNDKHTGSAFSHM